MEYALLKNGILYNVIVRNVNNATDSSWTTVASEMMFEHATILRDGLQALTDKGGYGQ